VGNAEDIAGGGELGAAHAAELFGGGGVAAVGRGLAVGEADDVGLDAAVSGEGQDASKGKAFVVRMRYDQHHLQV
jgi:hypothetical protein